MEKRKTKIRFPTFPHATRDDDHGSFPKIEVKSKSKPRRLRRQKNNPKKESITHQSADFALPIFRLTPHWNQDSFSGSFPLESNIDFRLTFGLENAVALTFDDLRLGARTRLAVFPMPSTHSAEPAKQS